MKSDADRFWDDTVGKIRKAKGLCPLTPEEADAAFDAAPEVPMSADEIAAIVDAITSGELASWEPLPQDNYETDPTFEEVNESVLEVFRHEGEADAEAEAVEKELEDEMLNDNATEEDQGGLADGTTPTGPSQ
jgi:hypothetical protein